MVQAKRRKRSSCANVTGVNELYVAIAVSIIAICYYDMFGWYIAGLFLFSVLMVEYSLMQMSNNGKMMAVVIANLFAVSIGIGYLIYWMLEFF